MDTSFLIFNIDLYINNESSLSVIAFIIFFFKFLSIISELNNKKFFKKYLLAFKRLSFKLVLKSYSFAHIEH